jgi:hypothetical protein
VLPHEARQVAALDVVRCRPPDDLSAEGNGVGHGKSQNGTLMTLMALIYADRNDSLLIMSLRQ